MAYKQVKSFNKSLAGKIPGYCLANVRRGFGIASNYPTAIKAWGGTKQHRDRSFPSGVDVPLFYTYGKDGHINVRLSNGKVWSDGDEYANLDTYLKTHPKVSYLGWGESVNGVSVLQYVPDPVKPSNPVQPSGMPAVNSSIQLIPNVNSNVVRTTYKKGTATVAGRITVPPRDNSFVYTVRGYDDKYPGRIIINSASGGGNGVGLALYYLNGSLVEGWKKI